MTCYPDTLEEAKAWLARLDAMHPFAKDLSWSHCRAMAAQRVAHLAARIPESEVPE